MSYEQIKEKVVAFATKYNPYITIALVVVVVLDKVF